MKKLFIFGLVALTGCTANIKEYDAEKMEYEQIKNIKKAQVKDPFAYERTPDYVKVIEEDSIIIEVRRDKPLVGQNNIRLEQWKANAINNNDESKCVTVKWALQDFEFDTSLPSEFLLFGHEDLPIGKMRQTIWAFDGAFIALPPSGYVSGINIRDADINPTTGAESCEPDESNIDTI